MAGKKKTASQNYNELRALTKKLLKEGKKKKKDDESEQLFEDDPRAVEELEYGKVSKRTTHVWTKSNLPES
jgi:hypothetical protein